MITFVTLAAIAAFILAIIGGAMSHVRIVAGAVILLAVAILLLHPGFR